ncbi:hypothetical protein EVAR_29257_1 [Eumeta japonica]|uniref:Uncharacterized protein n=1 Tax=Eumeta variegata TaxID=151549 RepID=A0A4C1VI31_EUMVA|nr:hypothetical protein EVAR_29257_1 [Eumeta japonica]
MAELSDRPTDSTARFSGPLPSPMHGLHSSRVDFQPLHNTSSALFKTRLDRTTRRLEKVVQVTKLLLARGTRPLNFKSCQPKRWGRDHRCYAYVLRKSSRGRSSGLNNEASFERADISFLFNEEA